MKILHLTLKERYFDLILSGRKVEEYREVKDYWVNRLFDELKTPKKFDIIQFKNGYGKDVPTMTIEFDRISYGKGLPLWGAPKDKDVIIIHLGRILDYKNLKPHQCEIAKYGFTL